MGTRNHPQRPNLERRPITAPICRLVEDRTVNTKLMNRFSSWRTAPSGPDHGAIVRLPFRRAVVFELSLFFSSGGTEPSDSPMFQNSEGILINSLFKSTLLLRAYYPPERPPYIQVLGIFHTSLCIPPPPFKPPFSRSSPSLYCSSTSLTKFLEKREHCSNALAKPSSPP